MVLNKGLAEEGILEEAEFYNIAELITLIKERIGQRNNVYGKGGKKHVYRVLQCHEDELTQVSFLIVKHSNYGVVLQVDRIDIKLTTLIDGIYYVRWVEIRTIS